MPSTFVAKLNRDEMERRRLGAAKDLLASNPNEWGHQARVAEKYNVSTATVARWNTVLKAKGIEGLRRSNPPGYPSKLTQAHWARLAKMLQEGPIAHGYKTDLWTGPRVQRLIREKFGVTYNANYVTDALKTHLNLSWQKPRRVARERDEEKRQAWLRDEWPELKKGRKKDAGRSPS